MGIRAQLRVQWQTTPTGLAANALKKAWKKLALPERVTLPLMKHTLIPVQEVWQRCPYKGCDGFRHTIQYGEGPVKVLRDCPCGGGVIRVSFPPLPQ